MAPSIYLNLLDQLTPSAAAPIVEMEETSVSKIQYTLTTTTLPGSPTLNTSIESSTVESKSQNFSNAVRRAASLNKDVAFETFNPLHLEAAEALIDALYYVDASNLAAAVSFAKPRVNAELFNYVLCVIFRHRPDALAENVQLPSHVTTSPFKYIDMFKVKKEIFSQSEADKNKKEAIFVEIADDFTATDRDPEHFIAYFREDMAVNLHHRHWHEVYPFVGSKAVTNKDRRGELFYYMHQQLVARYNFERLSNSLTKVKPFDYFREYMKEGYFPKLDAEAKMKLWCPRQAGAMWSNLNRDGMHYTIEDMERWRERIIDAIDRGCFVKKNPDGTQIEEQFIKSDGSLEPDAINDLGNTIESTPNLSVNFDYYGNLHNQGHMFISYCHDPEKKYNEFGSILSHTETALRDPMFYRWHAFIDDIFQRYKQKLRPYTLEEREFPGVIIQNVVVNSKTAEENVFKTFWQRDIVDISEGILNRDPEKNGPVFVLYKHLQHDEFVYKIQVNNKNKGNVHGTVRIFIAPVQDETKKEPNFNTLRRLFIELDKFTVILQPGVNNVTRKSSCSSVTIPFEQSFMTKAEAKKFIMDPDKQKQFLSYCGCGWPHHLLIGKGHTLGFDCHLFVMISDYEKDKVEGWKFETDKCNDSAISYCGARDKKYPDKRPMGFPFDRNVADDNVMLEHFMKKFQKFDEVDEKVSNMFNISVKVKFFENEEVDGASVKKYKYNSDKKSITVPYYQ